MKWAKKGEYLAVSNTDLQYRIAKFFYRRQGQYRASFKGEFIGSVCDTFEQAKAICETNHLIMQEAKEIEHVAQE